MTNAIQRLTQWAGNKNSTRRWTITGPEPLDGGVFIRMSETTPRPLVGPPITKELVKIITREELVAANFDIVGTAVGIMIEQLDKALLETTK